MPTLRNSLAAITNYRLGYSPQRPYPWRWTTPLALFILLTITALLACLNIPLSAYETVQESTYFPNATIPALPMSNMIPSFLRSPGATFAPQTLHVGDTFQLNNSLWSYTIVNAFDGTDDRNPVSSFPYFNNPISDSCDVTNITVEFGSHPGYDTSAVTALVTCTQPTVFQMTWGPGFIYDDVFGSVLGFQGMDLLDVMSDLVVKPFSMAAGITVRPCCNCRKTDIESEANGGPTSPDLLEPALLIPALLEPPCSTEPARFIGLRATVQNTSDVGIEPLIVGLTEGSNITELFAAMPGPMRKSIIGSGDPSEFNAPLQNLFQYYYHLVRRDLGVILENNIYLSPEIFNDSIIGATETGPQALLTYASSYRAQTSNETLMAQWRDSFAIFNETDRVPVLQYPRPVPRLKPLGSAITSVFVATFAMVSTVWTIFSVVARAFVNSTDDSDSGVEKESFDVPLYREMRSFEVAAHARAFFFLLLAFDVERGGVPVPEPCLHFGPGYVSAVPSHTWRPLACANGLRRFDIVLHSEMKGWARPVDIFFVFIVGRLSFRLYPMADRQPHTPSAYGCTACDPSPVRLAYAHVPLLQDSSRLSHITMPILLYIRLLAWLLFSCLRPFRVPSRRPPLSMPRRAHTSAQPEPIVHARSPIFFHRPRSRSTPASAYYGTFDTRHPQLSRTPTSPPPWPRQCHARHRPQFTQRSPSNPSYLCISSLPLFQRLAIGTRRVNAHPINRSSLSYLQPFGVRPSDHAQPSSCLTRPAALPAESGLYAREASAG
ncbi:hypothetical protein DFH06DRAFT_1477283 [Mycena polygramma]|nr:hypothetical protein DFH06DRAFT_1477283 [Mycena polygramma]